MTAKTLSKLYERHSLRNTETGFELAFKNTIAPGILTRLGPLTVDDVVFDPDEIILRLERPSDRVGRQPAPKDYRGDVIQENRAVPFDLHSVARVIVPSQRLAPGLHRVALNATTKEVGDIVLVAEDSLAE